eukprot:348899_1
MPRQKITILKDIYPIEITINEEDESIQVSHSNSNPDISLRNAILDQISNILDQRFRQQTNLNQILQFLLQIDRNGVLEKQIFCKSIQKRAQYYHTRYSVKTMAQKWIKTNPKHAVTDEQNNMIEKPMHDCITEAKLVNCAKLNRLREVMHRYMKNGKYSNNTAHLTQILDNFFYLLQTYPSHKEFEIISQRLGYCDPQTCAILKMYFRDRNSENMEQSKRVKCGDGIICKIHCYYQHSIDFGNRLSLQEMHELGNKIEESKNSDIEDILINKSIIETNKILLEKRKRLQGISNFDSRHINKFSEFIVRAPDHEKDDKQTYKFGVRFNYNKRENNDVQITSKYGT